MHVRLLHFQIGRRVDLRRLRVGGHADLHLHLAAEMRGDEVPQKGVRLRFEQDLRTVRRFDLQSVR